MSEPLVRICTSREEAHAAAAQIYDLARNLIAYGETLAVRAGDGVRNAMRAWAHEARAARRGRQSGRRRDVVVRHPPNLMRTACPLRWASSLSSSAGIRALSFVGDRMHGGGQVPLSVTSKNDAPALLVSLPTVNGTAAVIAVRPNTTPGSAAVMAHRLLRSVKVLDRVVSPKTRAAEAQVIEVESTLQACAPTRQPRPSEAGFSA